MEDEAAMDLFSLVRFLVEEGLIHLDVDRQRVHDERSCLIWLCYV